MICDTVDTPDTTLIFDVIKSGNLSSLIVPVRILAPSFKLVALVAVPVRLAVIVPALKFPPAFLATIVELTLESVALLVTVKVVTPELL